jgi:beta-RFAP synthase
MPPAGDAHTAAGPEAGQAVRVDAPARLQMGLLDLRGDLGRLFGGIGAAVAEPRTVVEVETAADLRVDGPDAERATEFARRYLEHHGRPVLCHVHVRRAIPAHVGLGSGTQLALAAASGLAALHGLPADARSLVAAVRRGARSGVGSWTFERGGLVVDGGRGGRSAADGALAPLLARYALPPTWRCVLAIPPLPDGLSGAKEREAFDRLPPPEPEAVWRISHLVLMGVLPALVERDLAAFGSALTELQRRVGECFAPVQGGVYAGPDVAELVRRLAEAGAAGVGQSSWGPAVYAIVEGDEAAAALAERAGEWVGKGGVVFATAFDNRGARVTRLSGVAPCPE